MRIEVDRSRCADDPRHTLVQGVMGLKVICSACRWTDDHVSGYELQRLGVEYYAVRFSREDDRWHIDLYDGQRQPAQRTKGAP